MYPFQTCDPVTLQNLSMNNDICLSLHVGKTRRNGQTKKTFDAFKKSSETMKFRISEQTYHLSILLKKSCYKVLPSLNQNVLSTHPNLLGVDTWDPKSYTSHPVQFIYPHAKACPKICFTQKRHTGGCDSIIASIEKKKRYARKKTSVPIIRDFGPPH